MLDLGKRNLLGVMVNAIDYEAAASTVIEATQQNTPRTVSATAVHGIMTGLLDDEHRYRLNQLDLLVPDGQPVRWAVNLLHRTPMRDRVYGPTLMEHILQQAAALHLPIYLFGSRPDVVA